MTIRGPARQIRVLDMLKRVAAHLPLVWQHELRRLYFRRQIRRRRFMTDEKEYALLDTFLRSGDWVLDIGANVGHYTLRMSELVGDAGRVVAFEPVPETFALLAANARSFATANVSLLNVAASDSAGIAGIRIPQFDGGLTNYYQASLTTDAGVLSVLTLQIDSLELPSVKLAKIDVEGHELPVLLGMRKILQRDRPVLIVETSAKKTMDFLENLGYGIRRLPGSSNLLCEPGIARMDA
jgi:FkbM family methyltransferase